jgi:Spy/CpxP family protein refolding chaperone
MKKTTRTAAILAALLLLAAGAMPLRATTRATDYPGSVALLLGVPQVRADLDLTAEQSSRLDTLRRQLRSSAKSLIKKGSAADGQELTADQKLFGLIDRNNAGALSILSPKQLERFHEIQNRILGFTMLVSPKVQKQLGLSAAQVSKLETIRKRGLEFVSQTNTSFEDGTLSHKQRIDLLRNYRLEQSLEMRSVLTPSQLAAFTKLCGNPLAS